MSPLLLAAAAAAQHTPALPDDPTTLQNLEFQLVGLAIVLGVLTALYLLCAALGAAFVRLARLSRKGQVAATPEVVTQPPAEPPIAVIAAAVAAEVGAPHRIVEVHPAAVGWSLEGRRQHLTSHQLRK